MKRLSASRKKNALETRSSTLPHVRPKE